MDIIIRDAVARFSEFRFSSPVVWTLRGHEKWAVIGPNGAGKTLLTDLIQGRLALREGSVEVTGADAGEAAGAHPRPHYELIRSISFRDIYTLADHANSYYQQRWNATDAAGSPVTRSLLDGYPDGQITRYSELFGIGELLGKRLISLSSGELRKFLITRALIAEPAALILDNPFIGLDTPSRTLLNVMLQQIAASHATQIILVVSNPDDLPDWITHVQPVADMTLLPPVSRRDFLRDARLLERLFPERYDPRCAAPPELPAPTTEVPEGYEIAVGMDAVGVRYGAATILEGVDWEVRRGEKWALLGANGSGKSTLLSLVTADNPQAYANRIMLFGRRRGTGESIWDIKRRIGYLSPDVHTYYLQNIPAIQVVVSGFYDSVGLYAHASPEQEHLARAWLATFGALHLAERSFVKLSYGEQRLVLLARTLVKDPEMLILDEPLHGLDAGKKSRVKRIVESFSSRAGKTLIYVTHYPDEIPDCVARRKVLERPRNTV